MYVVNDVGDESTEFDETKRILAYAKWQNFSLYQMYTDIRGC